MTDDQVLRAVHAMEAYTGVVPGYRRAHARGVGFRAEFTPTPAIAELTSAEHLQGQPVPAVVRLSNGAGSPYAPDRKPGHVGATLGLAISFALASGGHTTWAAANLPAFPAGRAEDFIAVTTAQRPGPKGRPNLVRMAAFVARHRSSLAGLKGILGQKPTASFATTRFNGLHTYWLVAPDGTRRAFRYSWMPETGERPLGADAERVWPPQYLVSEISQRPEAAWRLVFTLADPGDPLDDVTQTWPDGRRVVDAGRLVLGDLHEDQAAVERVVFDPTNVVPGIELSDDPILRFRSQVYSESYARRTREDRPSVTSG